MFELIRKVMESPRKKGEENKENSDPQLKTHIAAGVLLLEAAHADNQCTEEEMEHVVATLRSKFNLTPEYAEELIQMAHTARDNAMDLWQFTNQVNQQFSAEEKVAILEDVWRIIHLDGQLDKHEDYIARKLANLLHLSHKQFIDAKIKARQQVQ
ncbi:MAG: TerB family tellurite resistance protein [Nitrospirota bacterium]|nr:TerB family tellurite resistance protein [Nitrospirota bacterium]